MVNVQSFEQLIQGLIFIIKPSNMNLAIIDDENQ